MNTLTREVLPLSNPQITEMQDRADAIATRLTPTAIDQADCLAACAAMILDYLHIPVNYARLQRLLNVRSFGAFFSDIVNLRTMGIAVTVAEGNLAVVQDYWESGLPVVAAVNTAFLPSYWSEGVGHALVIFGWRKVA